MQGNILEQPIWIMYGLVFLVMGSILLIWVWVAGKVDPLWEQYDGKKKYRYILEDVLDGPYMFFLFFVFMLLAVWTFGYGGE